jgi:hypothetical protein
LLSARAHRANALKNQPLCKSPIVNFIVINNGRAFC